MKIMIPMTTTPPAAIPIIAPIGKPSSSGTGGMITGGSGFVLFGSGSTGLIPASRLH